MVGVPDSLKGQVPSACVVLMERADVDAVQLEAAVCDVVRAEVGPIAALKEVAIVAALSKTRFGKDLRASLRAIAEGREYTVPATTEGTRPCSTKSQAPASRRLAR